MALSELFLINGREYEWADTCLNVGGVEIKGFRGANWKISQEKEFLHAKGRKPHSIQRGNTTNTGSFIFTQSEARAIRAAAGTRSLTDIQVDAVIAFVPENSSLIETYTFLGLEFTDIEKKMSQGDKFMEIELPWMALDIIEA